MMMQQQFQQISGRTSLSEMIILVFSDHELDKIMLKTELKNKIKKGYCLFEEIEICNTLNFTKLCI